MEKTSTKQHWQSYWKTPDHQPPVVHEEMLSELQHITNIKGKKILEVGAGMGGDSVRLAEFGASVTAVDYTQESLDEIDEFAKKHNVSVDTVRGDARELPFKDEVFDIVFHQGLLEHFKDPSVILSEHVRVLKKRGYLVVDVPQAFTTYTIKKKIAIARGAWFAGWERSFSIGQLEHLMREAGLSIVRAYGGGYYGKLHAIRNLNLGKWYEQLWGIIEKSRMKLYLNWCIGVIAQK